MFTRRKTIVTVAVAATVATIALFAATGASAGDDTGYKLEGVWVAKVQGSPVQWTYTLSPDPSGRRAALAGFIQVGVRPIVLGIFPDAEFSSPIVGELVIRADGVTVFNSVWYGMKTGFPFDQIVYIGMNSGEARRTADNKAEGTHNIAYYDPSSDQDGDGLPDPGAVPVLVLPVTTVDTRLPLSPP